MYPPSARTSPPCRGPTSEPILLVADPTKRGFIRGVKLSLRQKQTFYHELQQFLKSGIPLPQAVEALVPETRGDVRRVLARLGEMLLRGMSVTDAFAGLRPAVGELEVSLISASGSSGRLEQAFIYLSNYFGTLETVRAGIVRQAAWPLIQLHLGIIVLNAVGMLFAGGFVLQTYLVQTVEALGVLYLGLFALWVISTTLLKMGQRDVFIDRLLGWLPLVGTMRRNLALSRFCATYEMQLQAAINIMDGLHAAADASQSARIRAAIEAVVPQVRAGAQVGASLTGSAAFPAALQRALRIGEETGSLDADLRKWADYYQSAAIRTLEALGTWLPRIGNLLIIVYLGYRIVATYSQMFQGYDKMLNDM